MGGPCRVRAVLPSAGGEVGDVADCGVGVEDFGHGVVGVGGV